MKNSQISSIQMNNMHQSVSVQLLKSPDKVI